MPRVRVVVSDDLLIGEIDFSQRNAPKIFLTSQISLISKLAAETDQGVYLAANP
jgi:hypothetical protein